MQINKQYTSPYSKYNTTFKGIPHAKVTMKNIKDATDIMIYELEKSDQDFMKDYIKKIDLEKLAPDAEEKIPQIIWKALIKSAIDLIGADNTKVYLALANRKPCGVISELSSFDTSLNEDTKYISFLATWPDKIGHNVKCAGKSLLQTIFNNAQKHCVNVTVNPCSSAPKGKRSCVKFYQDIGFKYVSPDNSIKMLIPKDQVFETTYNKFMPLFDYREFINSIHVNLEKIIEPENNKSGLKNFISRFSSKKHSD